MNNKKIAFIVNPISGTVNKTKVVDKIKAASWFAESNAEIYFTKCAGDASEKTKDYVAQGFDIVVAVGGDGTVNEIASSLIHTNTALAIIPIGSGNGLARDLHIPLKVPKALQLLQNGKVSNIDACYFNGHPYFCTAGVGYDAEVGTTFAASGKRGFVSYVIAALKAYIKMPFTEYKLIIDDKEEINKVAFDITFANAGQFGNDAYISPLADLRDGLIDVVVIRKFPWYKCVQVGLRLFTKRLHKSRYVKIYQCKKAVLERPASACAHFDGEPFVAGTRIEISVDNSALKVIV